MLQVSLTFMIFGFVAVGVGEYHIYHDRQYRKKLFNSRRKGKQIEERRINRISVSRWDRFMFCKNV